MQDEQLFQVEDLFEKSFQKIIQEAGIQNVYRSREKREAQTPGVEVSMIVGAVSEKRRHCVAHGKPLIYSTSKTFMDYFGINQTADLPRLREVLGESLEEPSLINFTPLTPEITQALVVSEEGELLERDRTCWWYGQPVISADQDHQ